MKDFSIIMRQSTSNWGTGDFSAIEIFFSYGGLELGDASHLLVPQKNREPISISDIGFGLERIVWAINKTESYFDTLRPLALNVSKEIFDACRTLTLIVMCGVKSSNKGAGLQFRRFAKLINEKHNSEDVYYILKHYYDYWKQFINPIVKQNEVINTSRLEIERFLNIKIGKQLSLPSPNNETTENYFKRLVYDFNISPKTLSKAISQ